MYKNKYLKKLVFDEEFIQDKFNLVNLDLIKFINESIMPEYSLNDKGHNQKHIEYVMKRAFELTKDIRVDYNILYVSVAYHDITCHINRELHEKLSSQRVLFDENLKKYFNDEEINIISEAIADHRASSETEPRNIYGKILSSADRKCEIREYLVASIGFDMKKDSSLTKEELINNSRIFADKKFGRNGYAISKSYVNDKKYQDFLNDVQYLIKNENDFYEVASIIYEELKEE